MTTISLNEAQSTLAELIHRLAPGEVIRRIAGSTGREFRDSHDATKEPR
jgi:hypothetical protein